MEKLLSDIIQESKTSNKKDSFRNEHENTKSPFSKLDNDSSSSIILDKLKKYTNEVNKQSEQLDRLLLSDIGKIDINNIHSPSYYNNIYYKYHYLNSPKNNNISLKKAIIRPIKKQHKYLFKDCSLLAEKIKKTKIKEFSLSTSRKRSEPKNQNIFNEYIKNKINQTSKNIPKFCSRKNSAYLSPQVSSHKKINFSNNSKVSGCPPKSNDSFFITRLSSSPLNNSNIKSTKSSTSKDLIKFDKVVKQSNKSMLDIYNGLKDLNNNYNNYYYLNKIENNNSKNFKKNKKLEKLKSTNYINRKFTKLYQNVIENKKYSNQKIDARILLEPLKEFCGVYKEIKLDNHKNNKVGKRIWIKKSTANLLSFGKSFQLISDTIFNREKKRIISFYPKIMKDCELRVPYKKIKKVNPYVFKIKENINKANNIFVSKYNLLQRVHSKYD